MSAVAFFPGQAGRGYELIVGMLLPALGARALYHAYRGIWFPGGLGSSQPPVSAAPYQRAWLACGGLLAIYTGYYFLASALAPWLPRPPVPGPKALERLSGVIASLVGAAGLYAAYKVNRTGTVVFRGEVIRAAWYHRLLGLAVGAGGIWAAIALFQR